MSPKAKSKLKTTAVEELSFEQSFEELEEVVRQLEEGQPSLDEAIALFERGQALAARCQALLESAELRVQRVAPKADGYTLEDFDADEA
ncbi:MAG: exodeoxyribonuclease VII small subunit [Anaerolineales bacterium]